MTTIVSGNVRKVAYGIARRLLPSDNNFWRVYSPVIRILKDSYEHRAIREKIGKYFDLRKTDIVLEEGCGRAIWAQEIEAQVASVTGLDNEEKMLAVAREQSPSISFVQADLNHPLPFMDGQFTKIGSILVEGYLRERETARAERFRILAPGGMLAIVTPRKGARFFKVLQAEARHRTEEKTFIANIRKLPLGIIAILFGKVAEIKAVVGDWHFYEKEELINFYREAGFEPIACESVYADQAWLLVVRKPSLD
ncbi:hypothetical protein A3F86_01875 [candidate division WOR-1 bacterium RIFCSPLOWO2_12_FULL_45_9]|uniref:Methyltransferase type 11 domain-containing protein n=1 Tax=candidate division WOR-1 bacterium RIFCSPLOWO2_12_FULL_45_9 TaxID=1802568 RepID=A0A1F4RQA1_UNCSA|nr:MAG: hypothetical protein A3F86_01875 [candidate division WOR-1 bacterium RIFCSPLOWO2_12_FULL_45_9]